MLHTLVHNITKQQINQHKPNNNDTNKTFNQHIKMIKNVCKKQNKKKQQKTHTNKTHKFGRNREDACRRARLCIVGRWPEFRVQFDDGTDGAAVRF